MIKSKRIIADSIKGNLIPQQSSRETPQEMFDALSSLFEGRNINRKMTLRNHLKNVKALKSETMQSHFKKVSQIKEQLEAIGDMGEEAKIVMTTLNGVSWNISPPADSKVFHSSEWFRSRTNRG